MRSKKRTNFIKIIMVLLMAAVVMLPMVPSAQAAGYPADYSTRVAHYNQHEVPALAALRDRYTSGSLAEAIGARAMWYMEYGYTVYGHSLYANTGYIDCSQYVSRVYADFGYSVTGASRKYTTVGTRVSGVYAQRLSNGKYTLVGTDKLRIGDIFTFWAKDSNGNKYISHVAMYVGKPNGKPTIINTVSGHPTAIGFVDNFSYWYGSNLYDVRRVLPSNAYYKGGAAINAKRPVIPSVYQMPKGKVVMPASLLKGF